jgi:hypothetical protein
MSVRRDDTVHMNTSTWPNGNLRSDLEAPNNLPMEQAILGSCLLHPHDLKEVSDVLAPGDFYDRRHERVYAALLDLQGSNRPTDAPSLGDYLGDAVPRVSRAYLHELIAQAGVQGNAPYYADILKRAARVRATQRVLRDVIVEVGLVRDDADFEAVLGSAITRIGGVIPAALQSRALSPYAAMDLEPTLVDLANGTNSGPKASVFARADGAFLLYPGAIHSISGEPGSGKSWAALLACAQGLAQGDQVGFLDFEDTPLSVVARLRTLGVTDDQIRDGFRYLRPQDAFRAAVDGPALEAAVTGCTIVVIDGITEAMNVNRLSPNNNDDVATWVRMLPNRIADLGAAVLQIDHVVKNSEHRGRFAIGGQHKLASITGVAYKAVTVKAFAKGMHGHTKLVIDKDKHGDVGPVGATATHLHVDATDPTGTVRARLEAPDASSASEKAAKDIDRLRPLILDFVGKCEGSGITKIREGVHAANTVVRSVVDSLVADGQLRTEGGPNSRRYFVIETY